MTLDSSASKLLAVLLAAAVLVSGQLVLSGCEVRESPDADGGQPDVEVELDGDAIEAARDAARETGDRLNDAGERIGDAADDAADAVRDATGDAAETVDENVDVGDNAGTPETTD